MKKKNAMNKEQVYDAQIAPLMAQIIDVCKANKIPMLATFQIPTGWNRITLAPESCACPTPDGPVTISATALDIATAGETLAALIPKGWSMTVAGRKE